jgi:hypothetical protein
MRKTKTTRSFFRWGGKPKEDSRHGLLEACSKVTADVTQGYSLPKTTEETSPKLNTTEQTLLPNDEMDPPTVISAKETTEPPLMDTTIKEFKLNNELQDSDGVPPKGMHPLKWVYIDFASSMSPRLIRSASELAAAVKEFKDNYQRFAMKYCQYHDLLIDNDFNQVFENISAHDDIKSTAESFGQKIRVTLQAVETRNKITTNKWTIRLGMFLKAVLPVANLSVNLAGALGEV